MSTGSTTYNTTGLEVCFLQGQTPTFCVCLGTPTTKCAPWDEDVAGCMVVKRAQRGCLIDTAARYRHQLFSGRQSAQGTLSTWQLSTGIRTDIEIAGHSIDMAAEYRHPHFSSRHSALVATDGDGSSCTWWRPRPVQGKCIEH